MTMHCLEYSAMEWRGHGKQPPEGDTYCCGSWIYIPAAGNDHSGYLGILADLDLPSRRPRRDLHSRSHSRLGCLRASQQRGGLGHVGSGSRKA